MSIVDLAGERVFLEPVPVPVRPVKSAKLRQRNLQWLAIKRQLGLSVADLAKMVRTPRATVREGLVWASVEEQRLEELAIASERHPVVHEATGLDAADVAYLMKTYPPGTEIGDNPLIREFLSRMAQKVLALGYSSPAFDAWAVA